MNISFKTTTIELSPEEAIEVYYALKSSIKSSIKDHWVNHPDAYKEGEKSRLDMLSKIGRSVGHDSDVQQELLEELGKAVLNSKTRPPAP